MKKNYHFIGIGGIGMSGLARLLLSQNYSVSGSDIAVSPVVEELIKRGAVIHKGHAAEHLPHDAIVVFSSDIKKENPEYEAAVQRNCPIMHRADLLAELIKGHKGLAVAGTHGKTTTSSLLASTLFEAGLDPSFAIGGILPVFQSNARLGTGDYFAVETDESDRSFLKFHPYGAIVTNIDNDHLNNYEGSFDFLVENFRQFMSQVESPSRLLWCRDDPSLCSLAFPGQTYGFHPASDWRILSMEQRGFSIVFDLEHRGTHEQKGRRYSQIELRLIGRHNALNGAAVFALATTLGINEEAIRQAFKDFKGVLRRCEHKGSYEGISFLDDYAHHPTEIEATLEGMRRAIGGNENNGEGNGRLIVVFQPHRYSRTKDCLGSYGTIFDRADELILTDIYGAGETPIPHLTHEVIQKEIQEKSKVSCRYIPRPAIAHFLSEFVRPHDTVATLGAGDITKVSGETLVLLEKRAPLIGR